jgi:hypothetical protein
MKKINIILYILVSFCMFTACTDLDNINNDPTKSSTIDPNLLVASIQFTHSWNLQNCDRLFIYPGGFINHWTGSWGQVYYGGFGQKSQGEMERLWTVDYSNQVKNIEALLTLTKDNPSYANLYQIGRILKVEMYQKLTDYYGDIPYSEAGKSISTGIYTVKYDKQEDIYHDFLKELKEAANALTTSGDSPTDDLYFNGNIAKWKKFANSLRLRIALHLIKVDPTTAQSEAEDAIKSGIMESNNDIAYVKHEASTLQDGPGNGFANIISKRFNRTTGSGGFKMTDEFISSLTSRNDPRISVIGGCYYGDDVDITDQVVAKVGYMGVPAQLYQYGDDDGNYEVWAPKISVIVGGKTVMISHYSQRLNPSKYLFASNAPYIHLSYAETQFLCAEAKLRGWNLSESAETYYKRGLQAACDQWSLFGATLDANKIKSFVNSLSLPTGKEMEEVQTQIWILLNMDPIEAWTKIRLTGMPSAYTKFYNYCPSVNQTGGKMPRRMQYPLDEQAKNSVNLKEAVDRMGGTDDWMNRMWWDKE